METVFYTNRSNARRAALRLIGVNQAPSTEFEIVARAPDRHEIVWLTGGAVAPEAAAEPDAAESAAPDAEAVEAEIAGAAAPIAEPAPALSVGDWFPDATGASTTGSAVGASTPPCRRRRRSTIGRPRR